MAELTLRNVKLRLRLNLRQKLIPIFCMPTTMEQARLFIIPITMDMDTDLEDTMYSEDTMEDTLDTMDIPTATMATMANKDSCGIAIVSQNLTKNFTKKNL